LRILILPKPPIIRDIEVKSVDAKKANAYFGLDVIMLLDDATLMLGKYTCRSLLASAVASINLVMFPFHL
jgi:hypothetical protein